MEQKRIGKQTVRLSAPPTILGAAAAVGPKEGEGPLGRCFDIVNADARFGEKTWEQAESKMQKLAFHAALEKAQSAPERIDYLLAGDLLNQCTASTFALRDSGVPFLGLFGACSTFAEGLGLAAMLLDGGFGETACAVSSSHFCTAERQFRQPLEYGGQRCPTAQWTATAAGAIVLGADGQGPYVTHVTIGRIRDAGITDANNMGAAMAQAAYDTLCRHFDDRKIAPDHYDLIVTGDLGRIGRGIVLDFFQRDGVDLSGIYDDCGMLLFDPDTQDVHAGASGCGCSAAVLCAYLLEGMRSGRWNRLLFCGTGALMSPTSSGQGESIPGVCHAVAISNDRS